MVNVSVTLSDWLYRAVLTLSRDYFTLESRWSGVYTNDRARIVDASGAGKSRWKSCPKTEFIVPATCLSKDNPGYCCIGSLVRLPVGCDRERHGRHHTPCGGRSR
ncbi:hypothetical protein FPZ52_11790 (plasmid) [Qingshengfaniella alkalisoli]|uniref:Uncharacterized protein n=1 Tax=Qingshengfaniella alkalisoli TaxID=2599296 RepID=A0A5B8IW70_9RHOB|nr:hypothetical protein FPZ52_11790 [Qingshengfaniella alkalisoli]